MKMLFMNLSNTGMCVRACMHSYMHASVHVCPYQYVRVRVRVRVRTYVYAHIHVVRIHMLYVCVFAYTDSTQHVNRQARGRRTRAASV